ncbi:hypothetical protein Taro_004522 [Colocasia esculenta]|uniref:Uncharacterized protein n=1 Tax=Colocasia esculenta TaxID=4460 RepID=A0A843TPU1_COLES|nr:hypothetical protein [Colocasia esculenta]
MAPASIGAHEASQTPISSAMIRTLKKLKAWSKKRARKRKRDLPDGPPTRFTRHQCCTCCSHSPAPPFQPTAPPLPPWLDFEHHPGVISHPVFSPVAGVAFPLPAAEISAGWVPPAGRGSEITPLLCPLPAPGASILSYQQYLVPDPVYGAPVDRLPPAGRAPGLAGCSGGVVAWLRRCIFCCFGKRILRPPPATVISLTQVLGLIRSGPTRKMSSQFL